ncbi:MAG: phosphodiester glycosidase family protein [Rhodobacter sp.]|nr:phosphodiester glycosidase family protein [Rhodobacter sp.]
MLALPDPAKALCRDQVHEGRDYTVCEVTAAEDLRLFQTAPDGKPFGTFDRINAALAGEGATLGFAMNAGMYHPDRAPVGLMIENGEERARIVTSDGPGNFGLLPNGVFCISDRFAVIESRAFKAAPPRCRFATQSGPMLVIDGALHPRFIPDSPSRYIRNGVGVSADGSRAYFVISQGRVNFAEFARLFRDALRTPQALYFDGNVSRLFAPDIGRRDMGFPMGPIVGTVVPAG